MAVVECPGIVLFCHLIGQFPQSAGFRLQEGDSENDFRAVLQGLGKKVEDADLKKNYLDAESFLEIVVAEFMDDHFNDAETENVEQYGRLDVRTVGRGEHKQTFEPRATHDFLRGWGFIPYISLM